MNFKKYIESSMEDFFNSPEMDQKRTQRRNDYEFGKHLLKTKYSNLKRDFRSIIFSYEERNDLLYAGRPIELFPDQGEKAIVGVEEKLKTILPNFIMYYTFQFKSNYNDSSGSAYRAKIHRPEIHETGQYYLDEAGGEFYINSDIHPFTKIPDNQVYTILKNIESAASKVSGYDYI